jgi:hypothetical protein
MNLEIEFSRIDLEKIQVGKMDELWTFDDLQMRQAKGVTNDEL